MGAMAVEPEGADGCSVLIVEDSENSASMLEMAFLGIPGLHVLQVPSGVEAMRILDGAANPVRAVVTDLNMPRMDGFELIDRVRRSEDPQIRDMPAAALTAFARSEDRRRALRSGFQVHLAKPIDPGELMAAMAALAGRPSGDGVDGPAAVDLARVPSIVPPDTV